MGQASPTQSKGAFLLQRHYNVTTIPGRDKTLPESKADLTFDARSLL